MPPTNDTAAGGHNGGSGHSGGSGAHGSGGGDGGSVSFEGLEMKELSAAEAAARNAVEKELLVEQNQSNKNEASEHVFPNGGIEKIKEEEEDDENSEMKKKKNEAKRDFLEENEEEEEEEDGESAQSTFQMAKNLVLRRVKRPQRDDGGEGGDATAGHAGSMDGIDFPQRPRPPPGPPPVLSRGGMAFAVVLHAYLAWAIAVHWRRDLTVEWCDGLGFIIFWSILFDIYFLVKAARRTKAWGQGVVFLDDLKQKVTRRVPRAGDILTASVAAACILFCLLDALLKESREPRRLVSVAGIFVIIGLCILVSRAPRKIIFQQVAWGFILQFILALIMLRWDTGRDSMECIGQKVEAFLDFTDHGSELIYGYLVSGKPFMPFKLPPGSMAQNVTAQINARAAATPILAFKSLSVVYFFSFFINICFYYGVIQWTARFLGVMMGVVMQTTPPESLTAAGNIFLGQALAPLMVKPYLRQLTLSEVHAVMASGFATVAGVALSIFLAFGVPAIHLLTASFMSAPASLAAAKLIYPELRPKVGPPNNHKHPQRRPSRPSEPDPDSMAGGDHQGGNVISFASKGANDGAVVVMSIVAIAIAFVSAIAFLNSLLSHLFGLVGYPFVTFEYVLGLLFTPLAFVLGIPWHECREVGRLIGIKVVVAEFYAFQDLGRLIKNNLISSRSAAITTYAMCGFTNPAAAGITLAVFNNLCPQRRQHFANLCGRAFLAGMAANLMTACIAGALLDQDDLAATTEVVSSASGVGSPTSMATTVATSLLAAVTNVTVAPPPLAAGGG